MSYKIEFSRSALKQIKKLSSKIQSQIAQKIQELSKNPRDFGSKKLVTVGSYRVKIGDYRIIYDINDKLITILIIRIGHRKDIYESL